MIGSLSLPLTDVIQIDKTAEYFRLLYDIKGRFTIHRITSEEAKVGQGQIMHTVLRACKRAHTMRSLLENMLAIVSPCVLYNKLMVG